MDSKGAPYNETENHGLLHQSNNISETASATNPALKTPEESKADLAPIKVEIVLMDEKNEQKARPPHKRRLSQDYLSRKHFIELAADKIERFQLQLLLLKQKDPAEEVYPSLRLSSELSMDMYTTGDVIEDMNEEEVEYHIRINQIIKTTWSEHDPKLKTHQECDSLCRERIKESDRLYDKRIMESRKTAMIRELERITLMWGERADDELQFLSLPQDCMGVVLPDHYIEYLIAKRKIEIRLLRQELEKRAENK
ncbi:hypothetical protein BELL_0094g00010 [Botrytis elliptica]|uniref:Uncharacterized protein n=1 Tax=Botrytis elliptica TaxID=278938 RepID=A0A4Z1JV15_9HELO|nr:hypothetical protein EAE99_003723 [Botrytis elliptica]TGO77699.1 hypothetical protein BELL_0094g00010 [Botrytis elliptica]